MPRPKGSRNRKTVAREAAEEALLKRAEVSKSAPIPDRQMLLSLDGLAVIEETMRHFYFKAKVEESLGERANIQTVDDMMEKAARWAKEVINFRHARLSAIKLAGDPNNPLRTIRDNVTAEELRAELIANMEKLGLFVTTEPPLTRALGIQPPELQCGS
jgi:hypothetical protein